VPDLWRYPVRPLPEEDRIKTVRVFSNQVMAAVLDGRETAFFDLVEAFFEQKTKAAFDKGYSLGFTKAFDLGYSTGYSAGWAESADAANGEGP
jgi:hypothetical protein